MQQEELTYLVRQMLADALSSEEKERLRLFMNDEANREQFVAITDTLTAENETVVPFRETYWMPVIEQVTEIDKPVRVHPLRKWGWAAAAAVVLLISGAAYLLRENRSPVTDTAQVIDIAPGHEGAVLTLDDGRQVVLDSLANGVVATQQGSQAVLQNGQLSYTTTAHASGNVAYNTMTTPKGRTFHITLPDGTGVWLNAASSIRYPTLFPGKERNVEITGEVYFEVAKDVEKPFFVKAGNKASIQVLGTHFNVNAYSNETSMNTTLLEGSIRMIVPAGSVVLKPGEQARVSADMSVAKVDIDKVMAWKNGRFNFESMRLKDVMKQLERWYDIEVVYEEGVQDIEFYGELSRNKSLSGIINALQLSDIHFRIEGRKLIVLP